MEDFLFDPIKQNYELAFHLNSNLAEAEVVQAKESFENLITNNGGTISFAKVPEKARLSYPINHQRASYFGYVQFSLEDTTKLAVMEEELRLNNSIIRYLILKLESDAQRAKTLAKMAERRERQKEHPVHRPQVETPVLPKDIEKMEKQLEDVIEKL